MDIQNIIRQCQQRKVSDIHVVCGLPIRIRIDGSLVDYDEHVMTHEDCEDIARQLVGNELDSIQSGGEIDCAITADGDIRCRLNIFRQQEHTSAAIRILSDKIPELSALGLPPAAMEFSTYPRGIVLVTGETGSGKSTTLAALLDAINHTRPQHIITLEDPIEYVYKPDKCVINQREIGRDTESYATGLKAILREDPDVILIGEMRELETIETALTAAETGHLVFATLHTNSAADAVDRIVNVFPGDKQQQIRLQLAMTLKAVLSQQLLPRMGGGRALATEVMISNSAIKNLIIEGKTPQLVNAIATGVAEGNQTMDNCLIRLNKNNIISREVAVDAAHDADYVRKSLGIGAANSGITVTGSQGRR